ncbi:hypothetical protein SAMN04488103_10521 [Gemmobacter aquatilis]|uniref:DUF1127 domain-containing protein n=1 Tax=Gemmobacter aquatilis TaxID=933059 RepID=A0A1H8GC89_9RHOB|nr:hypothetical protein [Gemmobacter aquatilis]SEN41603.1 hypothetical protein SAMN04488103_10521 [Gemmobacter aquatilis]
MTHSPVLSAPVPVPDLHDLIAQHGPWRVLRATLAAILRPRRQRLPDDLSLLGPHILRDLGLGPGGHGPF